MERTVRLQGGKAQLSPEEDTCTSAEGGFKLPCCHFGNSLLQSLRTGRGSRRWRSGKGGWCIPPPTAAAVTPVLGPLSPVPGRGGGSHCGGSDYDLRPLGSHSSSPTRETVSLASGDGPLWSKLNCGQNCHPSWVAGGAARGGLFGALCRASGHTSASGGGWIGKPLLPSGCRQAEDLEGLREGVAASSSNRERRVLDSRRLLGWVMLWIRLGLSEEVSHCTGRGTSSDALLGVGTCPVHYPPQAPP
jgi:hypothetical protein